MNSGYTWNKCKWCEKSHDPKLLCTTQAIHEDVRSILIENREQLNLYFMPCVNNWIH